MMNTLRKGAGSWVAKAFLILLVMSFAAWGIGDVFRAGGPGDRVAEVGGLAIATVDVKREADLQHRQLVERTGVLPNDAAIRAALVTQTLQDQIGRRLVDAHVAGLGLAVSDKLLAERIQREPAFQTAGSFQRARFDSFLRGTGQAEATFLETLRADMLRSLVVNAMVGPVTAPAAQAKLLGAYRHELRSGEALVVDDAAQAVGQPDDAALEAYLATHADQFSWPEYRRVSLVTLAAANFAEGRVIDEAELRAAYDRQPGRFGTPERRVAEQLLAADGAAIELAAARVEAGDSFETIAATMGDQGVTRSELGPAAKGELPAALDSPLFALDPGGVTPVVQTEFGFNLLRLLRIEEGTVQPFEAVRETLQRELALQQAYDELPRQATAFEDALAGGAQPSEAAATVGAKVQELTLDAQGQDRAGIPIPPDVLPEVLVPPIFKALVDVPSPLEADVGGDYHLTTVLEVVPARPKTLLEARDALTAAWKAEQAATAAKARAAALLAKVQAGKDPATLADAAAGIRRVLLAPVERDAVPGDRPLGDAVHEALFATAPGQPAATVLPTEGGQAVLIAREAIPADPNRPVVEIARELQDERRNALVRSYEAALRERFTIETYPQALATIMPKVDP